MKDSGQNIKNFLTTKRLLDQDRKSLYRDTSSKSLSRTAQKLRQFQQLQQDISPVRQSGKNYTHYEEQDRYVDPIRPQRRQQLRQTREPREQRQLRQPPSPQAPQISKKSALWSGITNVDNTFSSSKQESKQVLDSLSRKVQSQMRAYDNAIEDYRARLRRTFESEYSKFKEAVHQMVEKAFRRFEQEMREAYLEEEARVNREVYNARTVLDGLARTIEDMKSAMQTPHWKKVAGEILATDFVDKTQRELSDNADKLQLAQLGLAVNPHKRQAFSQILNDLIHTKVQRQRRVNGT